MDRFLKAVSIWADYIVIADEGSSDSSKEIAFKYKKVLYVPNNQKEFNEQGRQELLINEARKIPGNNLFVALDADELLTADSLKSPEWERMKNADPGTVFLFHWNNIRPGGKTYWEANQLMPFGFMDDRKSKVGHSLIHNPRIPFGNQNSHVTLNDIKILHLQYINWERMKSKHRWYMCYETVENRKPWWKIYLEYHHMYAVNKNKIKPIPKEWIDEYKKWEIDITAFKKEKEYWWDKEVLEYFKKYGVKKFGMLDIWDRKWVGYNDPQNLALKLFFKVLKSVYPPIYRFYIFLPKIKKAFFKAIDL